MHSASLLTFHIHDVAEYINWIYFFHAWGFQPRYATVATIHQCPHCLAAWPSTFPEKERPKAIEALHLYRDAIDMLRALDSEVCIRSIYRLCHANSDGDDLLLDGLRIPLLRQQTPNRDDSPYLCLSDFIRPLSAGVPDIAGIFATSVPAEHEAQFVHDSYQHLLIQTLNDRLTEAATERMHLHIRRDIWGYAPHEALSIPDLLMEKFQGIRPAVGYPSLPDQSVNFLLAQLLPFEQAGITLTENGAMSPHASVCGLMLAHPAARYFSVGQIGEDQLQDYAHRRGLPVDVLRKFLAANLTGTT